ncbi:MAG: glycosyltransferase, partial [Myxococcota bacterium]
LGALVVTFQRLFLDLAIPGYAFLVVGMFLLGGVQLLMLGIIGEYVGRIYVELQARPLYIVAERSEEKGG